MKPVTDVVPTFEGDVLTYAASTSYGYALTSSVESANAGYIVIDDESAPATYDFEIDVEGKPAVLTLTDGAIYVADAVGTVVNIIAPAWALDANGAAVATSYTVEGNVVTQHVAHEGSAYPVVADPGLACDFAFCTYMYSKEQTRIISLYTPTAAVLVTAGCTALAGVPGGLACAFSGALIAAMANDAKSQGRCIGIRKFLYVAVATYPVIENC